MYHSTCMKIVSFGLAATLGLCSIAVATGCSQKVVGTSSNDKYTVFQSESDSLYVPSPVEIASTKQGAEVSIVQSGWWAKDCYIHYGLKLTNPNANLIARDVVIEIISYSEAGAELSRDQATISFIGPNTTIGFAGTAGNGEKPARVEMTLVKTTTWQDAEGYVEPLLVASVEESDKGYYRYEFTGGVTNNTGSYASSAPLCILLEDEQGNILAGYEGSTKRIKTGRTKDYQVTINTAPDHAKVEVFAQWSSLNDTVNAELADEGGED